MSARVIVILGALLALLCLAEWLWAPHHHPLFVWHRWPGFQGLLGLGASLALTLFATLLGRSLLQRAEDRDA